MAKLEPIQRDLEDRGLIGRGGMGEVRRLWDPGLGRAVACKLPRAGASAQTEARLLREARVTARLAHPGVVAVHQLGLLPDGRPCFSMEEVQGRTLETIIAAVHRASPTRWGATAEGWSLRRLIEAFRRACETLAFAHDRGVLHRDIKPANLMIGQFGEVRVLDWGLALALDAPEAEEEDDERAAADPRLTMVGQVAGSPAWMAPEQAAGDLDALGPPVDVWGLGAVLYQILCGEAPFDDALREPWRAPPPLRDRARLPVPEELLAIVERAMASDPEDRYPDAGALAEDVAAWLEGTHREERARTHLRRGDALSPHIEALNQRARDLREEAARALSALPRHAPVSEKRPLWALEDEAATLEREAALSDVERRQLLQAALTEAPDLEEAHQRLADLYLQEAVAAEARRDPLAVTRLEALVRAHDRGAHAGWLRGEGALSLHTDPPGAEVVAQRLELVDRRLVPDSPRALGRTPLVDLRLPAGSYLLHLRAEGREPVRYPALLERGGRWDPVRPGEDGPTPLRLPRLGELGPDDVFVPAGPAWLGDPDLQAGLPRRRVWLDSYVIRRDPVTNRAWLGWLNTLVETGRAEEAARHVPALCPTTGGPLTPIYGRDADGRYALVPDPEGDLWEPEWPVVLMDWGSAMAFAAWEAERTGQPWRLAWEPEREKALRGVDGRSLPWGDHLEPTWTRNAQSSDQRPQPAPVGTPPEDESVYGARGLAGNVRDWTLSLRSGAWKHLSPEGRFDPPSLEFAAAQTGWRLNLGGAWSSGPGFGRAGYRLGAPVDHRNSLIGLRLARTLHSL